jgi:tetratricopeptide (TPR) repeat protein
MHVLLVLGQGGMSIRGGESLMPSLKSWKSEPVRLQTRRGILFWIGRAGLVAAATAVIISTVVWWWDRPLHLAEESLLNGDPKYAHYLLVKFLASNPNHSRAMALQGRVYEALGDPKRAIAHFDRAGADTAEDLRAWGRALLVTEQWSLAVPILERVVQMRPDDADALYELTACQVRLGLFERALENAQRFARLPGQEARGHLFMGAILHDLGKNEEAAEAYAKVLEYDPTAQNLQSPPADFYLQYGQTLLSSGQAEASLEPLKRSAAAQETPDVLVTLGNAALQLGRLDDAKAAWQRALVLDEKNVVAREGLAEVALQARQADAAIKWLAPLGEANPTLQTAYLRQRSYGVLGNKEEEQRWRNLATEQRKKQEFRGVIDRLVLDSPLSFWAQAVQAHRFAEQGNWRQAELLIGPLLKQAPEEPFLVALAAAIRRQRDLPALELLPRAH